MTVLLENLPFETERTIGMRARLGLIALATDYTVEHEYRTVLRQLPGVALYTARIWMDPQVTPETLAAMEARITPVAETLLPDDRLDAVAYGCTSASTIIGSERVADLVNAAKPDTPVTTPIDAALAAFSAFGARRVGVLTPYTADVNARVSAVIEAAGINVPVFASFNEPHDPTVSAISARSIRAALAQIRDRAEVDALFVSCTSICLLEDVETLEQAFGVPVTSSNHAMIWHSLRRAGIQDALDGLGRLYRIAPAGLQ